MTKPLAKLHQKKKKKKSRKSVFVPEMQNREPSRHFFPSNKEVLPTLGLSVQWFAYITLREEEVSALFDLSKSKADRSQL